MVPNLELEVAPSATVPTSPPRRVKLPPTPFSSVKATVIANDDEPAADDECQPEALSNYWDLQMDLRFKTNRTGKFSVVDIAPPQETPLLHHIPGQVKTVKLCIVCPYTRSIVQKAFSRRPWWRILDSSSPAEEADLQWGDYENIDWAPVLAGKGRANSYCIRKGLSRKAQFSVYLRRFCAKNPGSVLHEAVPETHVIETWSAFEDEMTLNFAGDVASFGADLGGCHFSTAAKVDLCLADAYEEMARAGPGARWILKASVANKGAEIFLVERPRQLREAVLAWPDLREWVLQRYVEAPLLLGGRKFHVRAYVLAVGALDVYFFDHCLVLLSGARYSPRFEDEYAHITNTAKQAEDPFFREERNVRLLADLEAELAARPGMAAGAAAAAAGAGAAVRGVVRRMRAVTRDVFRALRAEAAVFGPLPNAFELYGFDFLVTEDLGVRVLEANPGPDFKQTGGRLRKVVAQALDGAVAVAADGGAPPAGSGWVRVYSDAEEGGGGRRGPPGGGAGPSMRLV